LPGGLADVVAIGAGDLHRLAVKSDGSVVAWGSDLFGQATVPQKAINVVAVAGGGEHSLAVPADDAVTA